MSGIQTAIELQNNFTNVMYQSVVSVNLVISAMEQLHREIDEIQPVEVPVHWKTDGMEIFTSTGAERFRQEVQSINSMLEALSGTQDAIAKRTYDTNIFPPEGSRDLNNMIVRVDALRSRIRQIESNPLNMRTDTANAELEIIRGQLNDMAQLQQKLNLAVEGMDVRAANEAYLQLSQAMGNAEKYIRDNVDGQGCFNREIEAGTNRAGGLIQAIGGVIAKYATMENLSALMDLSDQMTLTTARLDRMNDGLQSTQELQNRIYLSAERSRSSYQATADAVSQMGLTAGEAFGSSEEIIAFTEQINKQFAIAGMEATDVDAAMSQLTQIMSSGVMRGEEYNSILRQAPDIIQAIADYMGVLEEKLEGMAAEGAITADIVKGAMFAAADETNAKFEQMPKTFAQLGTSLQNTALMAFQPILQKMSEIANSDKFQELVNGVMEGLLMVGDVASGIFDLLAGAAGAVAENWSWLSPVIYGVAAALGVYYGWLLLTEGAKKAAAAAEAVSMGVKTLAVPIYAALTGATMADTAAQWGMNSALYSCPIVWIIILIIALIALFYAVVAAINHFAGTSTSATGLICGAFMVALAVVGNHVVALINFLIDIFVLVWNAIAAVANFLCNVFKDPISAIRQLFFDLADTVLGVLQTLASAIDTIFGSNLAGSVQGWRDSLGGWVDETFGEGEEIMVKMNADDMRLNRFDDGAAWDAGYSFGEGIDDSIANFDLSDWLGGNEQNENEYNDLNAYNQELTEDVKDIAGNTGAIKDSVDITEEDLKYLRDIAEQEAVNRFTTAEIIIEQTNHNTVSGKMDLDGIISGLTDAANEAVGMMAEGVHV